jgi:hypothetical protein
MIREEIAIEKSGRKAKNEDIGSNVSYRERAR